MTNADHPAALRRQAPPMRFFLGTHQPHWLRFVDVPLFVSDRTLRRYKTLPRARGVWALDSGGFTELSTHGSWEHGPTPRQYATRIRRYADEVGGLIWAAPQDWMCEAFVRAKTGLSEAEHQHRTVGNFCELRALGAENVIPVVQGDQDYLHCVELYTRAGIDLTTEPVVGLGSVCRRQGTREIERLVRELAGAGLRLHGFGVKTSGLTRYADALTSCDSLAWSYQARRSAPLPGCTTHKNCANCPRYALRWRTRLLHRLTATRPVTQLPLWPQTLSEVIHHDAC